MSDVGLDYSYIGVDGDRDNFGPLDDTQKQPVTPENLVVDAFYIATRLFSVNGAEKPSGRDAITIVSGGRLQSVSLESTKLRSNSILLVWRFKYMSEMVDLTREQIANLRPDDNQEDRFSRMDGQLNFSPRV